MTMKKFTYQNEKGERITKAQAVERADRIKDPEDLFFEELGKRIRIQRTLKGLSQEALGKLWGCTFQQIQKYEKGFNRVSVFRLDIFCQKFGVDLLSLIRGGKAYDPVPENILDRADLEFIKMYHELDETQRAAVRQISKTVVDITSGI